MRKFITTSPNQTKNFAEKLAKQISLAKSGLASREKALVIGLFGDLGAGKTTFTQGFAKGLGIKQKIISPTFIILKKFKIIKKSQITIPSTRDKLQINSKTKIQKKHKIQNTNFQNFIHIDAYRLNNPKELLILNWRELIKNPENIILIEWADKIKKILPKNSVKISFKHLGKNKREISVFKNL